MSINNQAGMMEMFLFNREELYIGFSMNDAHNVMTILKDHGIKYQYKVNNLTQKWTGRGIDRNGSAILGINRDFSTEYIVYVKKENVEEAEYLIKTHFRKS